MNINRILISALMLSVSMYAMENQVNHECPGIVLAAQPDLRRSVTVNNENYFLIKRNGDGLTDHDRARLRQIVPFAIEDTKFTNRCLKYAAIGLAVGGIISASIFFNCSFIDKALRQLPLWKKCMWAGLQTLIFCCAGLRFAEESRATNPAKFELQLAIRDEISAGISHRQNHIPSNLGNEACCHVQDNERRNRHRVNVMFSRMALGGLYIPQDAMRQLDMNQDEYKLLETYLMQRDNPINETLNIPSAYRGNRSFVNSMMDFIKDCEHRLR